MDYSEFEATVANIQNYFESSQNELNSQDSRTNEFKMMKTVGDHKEEDFSDSLDGDMESETKSNPKPHKGSLPTSKNPSRDTTPIHTRTQGLNRKTSNTNLKKSKESNKNVVQTSQSPMNKIHLRRKRTLRKGPSFIPKEAIRMKEFERKLKEVDDKLTSIMKNSKNDIIPVIEKRLNGIREELENKGEK